uniref:Uncharacterized protein n=1 Tax=Bracon brevicornis TaxID=1563983 RepID=A0A6V7IWX7_9HYME
MLQSGKPKGVMEKHRINFVGPLTATKRFCTGVFFRMASLLYLSSVEWTSSFKGRRRKKVEKVRPSENEAAAREERRGNGHFDKRGDGKRQEQREKRKRKASKKKKKGKRRDRVEKMSLYGGGIE